ncbi:hypothetical protein [Candidatus Chlorohelix sp.]|uniref:hypothetical protein n=1 Tax=Candidatus Chlorohelix sp. TaxID=3139201 RepID=UPI003060EA1B
MGSRFALLPLVLILLSLVAFVIALLPRLDFFSQQVQRWLNFQYFQTGSEGLILNEVSLIRGGGSIYIPLSGDQFISAPYPPLYYYLVNWLWASGTNYSTGFATGRFVSLLSALLVAVGIVLLVVAENRISGKLGYLAGAIGGTVGGLVFLSLPAVAIWAVRVRADMLMTAFGILALALVAWKPSGWGAFAAILPLTLAFYTKQTALAAPIASLVYIILCNWHKRRLIFIWIAGFVAALGIPFIVLNLATGLQLYRRLFEYHNLPWKFDNFKTYLDLFTSETAALLIIALCFFVFALGGLIMDWRNQKGRQFAKLLHSARNIPLVGWYLLFSMPLLLGMGVSGADHNHFLPADAALAVGAGFLLARLLVAPFGFAPLLKTAMRWLALPVIGLLIWQLAVFSIPSQRYEIELRYRPDEINALGRVINNASTNPNPYILTSEAGFFVATGKPTTYNDLFTLSALTKQNLYDESRLLQRVKNKEFGLILAKDDFFSSSFRTDVWSKELADVIRQNYYLKFRDIWYTYEPKP